MYILVKPDQSTVYPYSAPQLRLDNRNISFRPDMSDSELADWGMYPVATTTPPSYDDSLQRLVEGTPVLTGDVWTQSWLVEPLTEAEVEELVRQKQAEINSQNREYLASTDWYVIRKMETGIEVPDGILAARAMARESIVEIV
jgi:hypothetical protein